MSQQSFLLFSFIFIFPNAPSLPFKDTVHDEEAEVPQQQHCQDEGRLVQNGPAAFLSSDTPAAPGGRQPIRAELLQQEVHPGESSGVCYISEKRSEGR